MWQNSALTSLPAVVMPRAACLISTEPSTSFSTSKTTPSSRVKAIQANNGFLAIPVKLSAIPGLPDSTQYVYIRRKQVEDDVEGEGESESEKTLFAVNLPYGSSEQSIKLGFQTLLEARAASIVSASGPKSGKGKTRETKESESGMGTVEEVDFVKFKVGKRGQTLLETEGIAHPDALLSTSTNAESNGKDHHKKNKKAKTVQEAASTEQPVHPLFISAEIDITASSAHFSSSPSTLKAHISFSSPRSISYLLNTTQNWHITAWPSASASDDHTGLTNTSLASTSLHEKRKRTTDEILYDLSRPSLESVKLHVDDWMRFFDATQPPASKAVTTLSNSAEQPKSKRAIAREAVAKAQAKALMERKKAIKKRRLYDDDYALPEVDEDGWTTVSRGGRYGRSAIERAVEGDDALVEDEEEIRKAELEGYASGKRSVGVARSAFVKAEEAELREERRRDLAKLNAKLGIATSADLEGSKDLVELDELGLEKDDSRGGGRGKRKKRSRGVEVAMYGFQRREDSKDSESGLLTALGERQPDKSRLLE